MDLLKACRKKMLSSVYSYTSTYYIRPYYFFMNQVWQLKKDKRNMSSTSRLTKNTISASCIQKIRTILQNDNLSILSKNLMSARNSHIDNLKENQRRNVARANKNKERKAAVLVPICTIDGTPSVLFTKRSVHMPTHPSQISFPGGYIKSGETPEQAALREMEEECQGAYPYHDKDSIKILGQTQSLPAMNGTSVIPVVAILSYDLGPNVEHIFGGYDHEQQDCEVEKVFLRSIQNLRESEKSERVSWLSKDFDNQKKSMDISEEIQEEHHNKLFYAPTFPGEEGKIWGLTAFILRPILKELLIPTLLKPSIACEKGSRL